MIKVLCLYVPDSLVENFPLHQWLNNSFIQRTFLPQQSRNIYARMTFTLVHLFNSQLFPSVVIEIQVFINEKSLAFTDEGALKNGYKISVLLPRCPGLF